MSSLFSELRRRNVFRVAAAYTVTAWITVEVLATVLPIFGAPDWVLRVVVILVVAGFVPAVFFAWAFELTAEGIKRESEVDRSKSIADQTAKKLDLIVIVLLVIAIGFVAVDRLWLERDGAGVYAGDPVAMSPADAGSAAARNPSIAVLPFADMSADQDQAYFADGLSEEILNLLARNRELKVTGRTSSFSFKGKDTPIPEIGRQLAVTHLLEGSVRKSGQRLRITAQLVEAETGFHHWSESFDRPVQDIFDIQDEIAQSIALALEIALSGATPSVTENLTAYDLYLQAREQIYHRDSASIARAMELINRALALDPDFPPALAVAGQTWLLQSAARGGYGEIPVELAHEQALSLLTRALELEPGLADAHAAMGLLLLQRNDSDAAQRHLEQALATNPSHVNAHNTLANLTQASGRLREAISLRETYAELDPLFLANLANLATYYAQAGDFSAAEQVTLRIRRAHPDQFHGYAIQSNILAKQGRLAEEAVEVDRALAMDSAISVTRWFADVIYMSLGEYEQAEEVSGGVGAVVGPVARGRAAEGLNRGREQVTASPANLMSIYALFEGLSLAGEHEELLDWVEERWGGVRGLDSDFPFTYATGRYFLPLAAAQRATGRDEELAATLDHWAGRLEFMREQGYADSTFFSIHAGFMALSGERQAALARLAEAIDLGYRNPLLARDPVFADLHDDPAFQAQFARMTELINIERAKLDMEPLR